MFHVTCAVNSGWIQVVKRPRPENLQAYCVKHQGHVASPTPPSPVSSGTKQRQMSKTPNTDKLKSYVSPAQAQRPKPSVQSVQPPTPKPAVPKIKPSTTTTRPPPTKPPLSSHQSAAKIAYLQEQLKSRNTELSRLKEEQKEKQEQLGRIAKELHLQEDASVDAVLQSIAALRLESRKNRHVRQGCATLFQRLGLATTDGISPSYDTMEAYLKSLQRSIDAHPLSDNDRIDIVRFAERKARKRPHPDSTDSIPSSSTPHNTEKRKKL